MDIDTAIKELRRAADYLEQHRPAEEVAIDMRFHGISNVGDLLRCRMAAVNLSMTEPTVEENTGTYWLSTLERPYNTICVTSFFDPRIIGGASAVRPTKTLADLVAEGGAA